MTPTIPDRPAPSPRMGAGCLTWATRIPAAAGLLVLVGVVLDVVRHGPVGAPQATVVGVIAFADLAVFVYLGALVEADGDRSRAPGRMLRVFIEVALLAVGVGLLALLSDAHTGVAVEGGTPAGGGSAATKLRANFASSLVDPLECAAVLGVASVEVEALGFESPGQSLADIVIMDGGRRTRTRLMVIVYAGRTARAAWARAKTSEQPLSGPGEGARIAGDRLIFTRGDTVVVVRGRRLRSDVARCLVAVAALIDRRLVQS